jgi:hypothetical protein
MNNSEAPRAIVFGHDGSFSVRRPRLPHSWTAIDAASNSRHCPARRWSFQSPRWGMTGWQPDRVVATQVTVPTVASSADPTATPSTITPAETSSTGAAGLRRSCWACWPWRSSVCSCSWFAAAEAAASKGGSDSVWSDGPDESTESVRPGEQAEATQ